MKKLSKETILKLAEDSETNIDYLVRLYMYFFGQDWETIESINGYPLVSTDTASFIMQSKPDKDEDTFQFNMIWLNKGFSSDNLHEDWKIFANNVVVKFKDVAEPVRYPKK